MTQSHTNARRLKRAHAMLNGPVTGTLAKLAAPNVIGMLATVLVSVAEGTWAALLGVEALATVALVFPFVMLTQTLAGGAFGGSTSAAVARALGAGDETRAGRIAFHALMIAVMAGAVLAVVFLSFGAGIFTALGGRGDILDHALAWGAVFFPGAVLVWLSQISASVMRGTGNMLLPSLSLVALSVISATCSGAFALGWGPLPALGVPGLALGLLTGHGVVTILILLYFAAGGLGFPVFADLRPARALFGAILRVAMVAALSPVQTILTTLVVTGFVARFGAEALAGYGLGARLEFLMIPITFGFGTAATAMVGTNIGAGNVPRARTVAWTAAGMAAALVAGIGFAVAILPDLWLGLFLDDLAGPVHASAEGYLRIVTPFYGFLAIGLALYFASQGAGRVFWPVMAASARLAVVVAGGVVVIGAGGTLGALSAVIAVAMVGYGLLTALAVLKGDWRPDLPAARPAAR
ncbi:MATE family efflux transporter [Pseudooceanicola nanhaiensis]|uniref:MATE family efflux transporter n=1 Tax=Pseudooceanicola nanhaiensis TaxID=375761 RepID=UPI00351803F4